MERRKAYSFIILMGLISLLSDATYETARSVLGPYLATLGASAVAVGFVSGLSEFVAHFFRLISGYIADRFKAYWFLTIGGYGLSLLSVPLLAFVPNWHLAAFLVSLERLGKAIRSPSRDALLSLATAKVGHGKGFGIHEFMDQLGATLGPLLAGLVLLLTSSYRLLFSLLLIPALLAMVLLLVARRSFREGFQKKEVGTGAGGIRFYIYLTASSLIALSLVPFPLISYHSKLHLNLPDFQIPLSYALAMLSDALSALLFGFLFDRIGFRALALGIFLSLPYLLLFQGSSHAFWLGVLLWGVSLGVQESIMRPGIALLVPVEARGRGYSLFYFSYGLSALAGGLLMGYLYSVSVQLLVAYAVGMYLLAVVLLLRL